MKILAIETSCDDTCVAIVEATPRKPFGKLRVRGQKIPDFKILSSIVSSQVKIHRQYGGVVPSLAKRAHSRNLVPVLIRTLEETEMSKFLQFSNSNFQTLKRILKREPELYERFTKEIPKFKKPKIDLIAVTNGPGLEPALWAGVNFSRALSFWWNIPLIGIDHMEGHIAANFLGKKISRNDSIFHIPYSIFPALCLAVSGGHTQMILIKDINKYKLLGETVDDAAGEGFDKVARMLGLSFPGGPEIAKAAKGGDPKAFDFPRPMLHSKDYNFSFSGLKTAVLCKLKGLCGTSDVPHKNLNAKLRRDIAASFQQAVVDVLIAKTIRAAKEYSAKTIMLAGGVAANKELRKQFGEKIKEELPNTKYEIPDTKYATDNAAMIAAAAYFRRNQAALTRWKTLRADGNLKIS